MSKHKSEQVALNIDWDMYGLINKINKMFLRKLWLVYVAIHMQGKWRTVQQGERAKRIYSKQHRIFDGFIEPIITWMFIA